MKEELPKGTKVLEKNAKGWTILITIYSSIFLFLFWIVPLLQGVVSLALCSTVN